MLFLCALAAMLLALPPGAAGPAVAQTSPRPAAPNASAAPGAGHGFLIDKHTAAGIACNACHTEGVPKAPAMATCLGCHGGSYDQLAKQTAADEPNPHQSHQGEVQCSACHHVHSASVTFCNQCHNFDMTTP